MSKPIFVIQLPYTEEVSNLNNLQGWLESKLIDWHVLVVFTTVKEVQFTAFSEQAATDVELESFKEMITNQLKQVV